MKTFSAMSTPDKHLTLAAYGELITILRSRIELDENHSPEGNQKLKLQVQRLELLREVLELDLLGE
jgi:hypothetical protein